VVLDLKDSLVKGVFLAQQAQVNQAHQVPRDPQVVQVL